MAVAKGNILVPGGIMGHINIDGGATGLVEWESIGYTVRDQDVVASWVEFRSIWKKAFEQRPVGKRMQQDGTYLHALSTVTDDPHPWKVSEEP